MNRFLSYTRSPGGLAPWFSRLSLGLGLCLTLATTLPACDDNAQATGGGACETPADCPSGSSCVDGVCTGTGQSEALLGGHGESCTRRADCAPPLACLANICVAQGQTDPNMEGTGGMEGAALGGPCVLQTDCLFGLVCSGGLCSLPGDGQGGQGGQGESCQTTLDCQEPWACIQGTCGVRDFDLNDTNRECVLIECEAAEDCCPPQPTFCPDLKAQCDAEIDMGVENGPACTQWMSSCPACDTEAWVCHQDTCIPQQPCVTDDECGAQVCDDGVCVQCTENLHCGVGVGAGVCVNNQCVEGCEHDAQCPPLHACQERACVPVGCQDNRECVACTGSVESFCDAGICRQACETDVECASPGNFNYRACISGYCQDVGCVTDEECKILTQSMNPEGRLRARCRERTQEAATVCRE